MQKTITVEKILEKVAKDKKPYKVIRSEGDGYFVWDTNLLDGVDEGDTIQITYDDGKYPKVSEIKLVAGEPKKKEETATFVERNTFIARSVALKAAIQAYGELKGGDDPLYYAKCVICLANTFEPWLLREEEVEKT